MPTKPGYLRGNAVTVTRGGIVNESGLQGSEHDGHERTLSRGEVAGRLLAALSTVQRWIDEGRLATVPGPRGSVRIPERALLAFEQQAFRRENFNGVDHGLHSWPEDYALSTNALVPVQDAEQAQEDAPRWPFPPAIALPPRHT